METTPQGPQAEAEASVMTVSNSVNNMETIHRPVAVPTELRRYSRDISLLIHNEVSLANVAKWHTTGIEGRRHGVKPRSAEVALHSATLIGWVVLSAWHAGLSGVALSEWLAAVEEELDRIEEARRVWHLENPTLPEAFTVAPKHD